MGHSRIFLLSPDSSSMLTYIRQPVVGFALIARSRTAAFARLSELLPSYIKYTCFVSGLGAALVVALAPTFDTVRIVYAVPTALGLVGIYGSLADIFNLGRQYLDEGHRMSTGNVIRSISFRTAGLCIAVTIFVVLSPFGGTFSMVKALFAGIVKALHWTAVFWLVCITLSVLIRSHANTTRHKKYSGKLCL